MSARPLPRRLASDRSGISAVEFALISPVMFAIICSTIDMGYVYMAQTSLTGAVARAARGSAATQESSQTDRNAKMRAAITALMTEYKPAPGGDLQVISRVYNDFNGAKPEPYTDANANGRYDPPGDGYPGDPFTDRNANGVRDLDTPKAGTTGEVGDVVRYTATFTVPHLFGFISSWNGAAGVPLSATSVVRNEPVKTE